jgi:pimeloyl-ACP methyl ester carboxylesterase
MIQGFLCALVLLVIFPVIVFAADPPGVPEGWQEMSGSMQTGDALSKIAVPSLILKAETSPEGRMANEEAVKDLPKVKLVHVDGAAHNLHHDDLDRTV